MVSFQACRDACGIIHQLLWVTGGSKVADLFTGLVSERMYEQKLVVSTEMSSRSESRYGAPCNDTVK